MVCSDEFGPGDSSTAILQMIGEDMDVPFRKTGSGTVKSRRNQLKMEVLPTSTRLHFIKSSSQTGHIVHHLNIVPSPMVPSHAVPSQRTPFQVWFTPRYTRDYVITLRLLVWQTPVSPSPRLIQIPIINSPPLRPRIFPTNRRRR